MSASQGGVPVDVGLQSPVAPLASVVLAQASPAVMVAQVLFSHPPALLFKLVFQVQYFPESTENSQSAYSV